MPVRIACPGCGTVYSLPEELSAKKIRCKQCQHVFVATSRTEQEEAVPEVLPCDEPGPNRLPIVTDCGPIRAGRRRPEAGRPSIPSHAASSCPLPNPPLDPRPSRGLWQELWLFRASS